MQRWHHELLTSTDRVFHLGLPARNQRQRVLQEQAVGIQQVFRSVYVRQLVLNLQQSPSLFFRCLRVHQEPRH